MACGRGQPFALLQRMTLPPSWRAGPGILIAPLWDCMSTCIGAGFVLSSRFNPVPAVTVFEAQIVILELLEHKPILTGGYKAVLHIHAGTQGCDMAGWHVRLALRAANKRRGRCPPQQVCRAIQPSSPTICPHPPCPAAVVEECEITRLVAAVDPKTKEKKKAKFVKSGAMCIARIAVEKAICIEPFETVPQVGAFVCWAECLLGGPVSLNGAG